MCKINKERKRKNVKEYQRRQKRQNLEKKGKRMFKKGS